MGLAYLRGEASLGQLSVNVLEHIPLTEKEEMRELALRGGPYSSTEQVALLYHCQTDVDALIALLPEMASDISIGHALIRDAICSQWPEWSLS